MRNDLRQPEIITQIKNMRNDGMSLTAIGKKFNCSGQTIKTILEEPITHHNYSNEVGKKYKTITVLRRASKEETPWKSHETPYCVKCNNCGREWVARKSALFRGCMYCEHPNGGGRGNFNKNKIGRRFGFLTVIDYDSQHFEDGNHGHVFWKCKCDCGNEISVRWDHLLGRSHSHTISCGCYTKSAGELKIEQILDKNKINFQEQYIIPELSQFLKFDFAIFNNNDNLIKLIEYDGKQHFEPVEKFGGEEKLKIQQERDNRKNKYCKEHNIPLLRIPYWDFNKINIDLLMS